MVRALTLLVALCVVGACFAANGEAMKTIARDDEPSTVPQNWVEIDSTVDYTSTVNLTVVLQRRNMEQLQAEVDERSNPKSPIYAKWFTREEIQARTAPLLSTVKTVMQWLESVGVSAPALGLNQDTIVCLEVPLTVAEKVLDLKFRAYQETVTNKVLVRAVGVVRVPESVSKMVQAIVGASGFPITHSIVKNESPDYIQVTPSVVVTRYNVSVDAPTNAKNLKAVAEFQGQYILQSDLCTFYSDYSVKGNCQIHQIIGNNQPQSGIESALDVEYISATAGNIPLDFYIFGGMDFCTDMVQWTTKLLASSAPGFVHSVSYGAQYYTPICDATVRDKIDQDLMTLSGRGISIIIASGDSGSGQYSRVGYNNGFLVPSWPAESPYATSVGATFFYNGNEGVESAVTQFGSGGGFSWNEKTQPTWQQAAVTAYFATQTPSTLPPSKSYNPTGRATPDVSALGENYVLIVDGSEFPGVGGTSASTPVFAGIVTRLNDIRLNANKGTLGCVNQLIYQNPSAFYDVTIGSNAISPNTVGWNCAKGWDPVTGLGTPNYKALEAVVQALP